MRWRMIAEKYGEEFHYIQGSKNKVSDALSSLGLKLSIKSQSDEMVKENPKMQLLAQAFDFNPAEVQPPAPTSQKCVRPA